jgi:hypothetical protein
MFGIPSLHAATGSNIILDNESSIPKLKLNSVIVSFIRYRRRHSRKTHPSETYPRNTCPIPTPMLPLNPRQRLPSQVKSSQVTTRLYLPPLVYLFHMSPKIPAPLGIDCSSKLALRAAALSLAGSRFIAEIFWNISPDC